MIRIRAEKNRLQLLESELIVSGTVDRIDVAFCFSDDWAGLSKTVVFRSGCQARDVLLVDGGWGAG